VAVLTLLCYNGRQPCRLLLQSVGSAAGRVCLHPSGGAFMLLG